MIKALALTAAATAAVIAPTAALAEFQSGRLAGYEAVAYDSGSLDVLQIYGPRGTISVAVNCYDDGDFTWVGKPGDGYIVERAVQQWCF